MPELIPGSSLMYENRFNSPSHTALSLRKSLPLHYGTLGRDIPTANVSDLQQVEVADYTSQAVRSSIT